MVEHLVPVTIQVLAYSYLNVYFFIGQSNSNSDTCVEFRVKYVGAIEKLKLDESKTLEGPLDLINYIDVAQVNTFF